MGRAVLQRTETTAAHTHTGGRPAAVYRFRERRLLVTDQFPAFRPQGPGGS